MTREESLKFLNDCIDKIQNITPEQAEKIKKICEEESKKDYSYDDFMPILPGIENSEEFVRGAKC